MAARVVHSDRSIGEAFLPRLHADKWTRIGTGKFGAAFAKGNLVWKVEAGDKLSGWADYVIAVAKGYFIGPHAPKVKLVMVFRNGVAALMERLDHSLKASSLRPREEAVRSMIERHKPWDLDTCALSVTRRGWPLLRAYFRGLPVTLWQFGRKLNAWQAETGYYADCHSNNVMLRRNGELVVIDPVSDGSSYVPGKPDWFYIEGAKGEFVVSGSSDYDEDEDENVSDEAYVEAVHVPGVDDFAVANHVLA